MAKVYKKISANGLLCLYLGKRDFVDHMDSVDVVDGVIKVKTSELDGRKVWVKLSCTFHYGREDLDVIGLSFRKDFWIQHIQIYPPTTDAHAANTHMQDALIQKVGAEGYPFTFNIPTNLPCSLTVHPAPDKGKACGVGFEVKAFVTNEADELDEKTHKRDTCSLVIRKIQFAPSTVTAGPKVNVYKHFIMSDKSIHLEASIEKEVYHHGEPIPVKVKINNETHKVVKKIKLSIEQTTDIVLYSADKYTKVVLCEEFWDQVKGGSTFEKEYRVTPLLANIKEKCGLTLDGRLKDEDTNLASSTIFQTGLKKDVQGILVSYRIKVHVMVAGSGLLGNLISSDIITELPLTLMSPKPAAGYTSTTKSF
ncbi:arrestin 3b, retinal (X-arrestin) [Brachyhypopomus gauderio]|uniref:arrestin 3b, retinal (X-arrestin) n=1 Tax=Brachyhypopomus gauderio TaxID=698409 RepID=UPI0040436E7F